MTPCKVDNPVDSYGDFMDRIEEMVNNISEPTPAEQKLVLAACAVIWGVLTYMGAKAYAYVCCYNVGYIASFFGF